MLEAHTAFPFPARHDLEIRVLINPRSRMPS